ncbi:MAG TPA: DUF6252 family protein [Flavobacterium sp.]|nr:DUF6252 family protein [Flavobacterium sp.]
MKKIASLLLILIALGSCTQDITKNSPSFQGLKDDVFWRAKDSYATVDTNGYITITGVTQYETVTLKTGNANPGTYIMGVNTIGMASYVLSIGGEDLIYETGAGFGDGQIEITEYDTAKHTVSGTFRFNAVNVDDNPSGGEILNFHEGNFYKVPVVPAL